MTFLSDGGWISLHKTPEVRTIRPEAALREIDETIDDHGHGEGHRVRRAP
jgi:hypothetical protein